LRAIGAGAGADWLGGVGSLLSGGAGQPCLFAHLHTLVCVPGRWIPGCCNPRPSMGAPARRATQHAPLAAAAHGSPAPALIGPRCFFPSVISRATARFVLRARSPAFAAPTLFSHPSSYEVRRPSPEELHGSPEHPKNASCLLRHRRGPCSPKLCLSLREPSLAMQPGVLSPPSASWTRPPHPSSSRWIWR
jgi:hypothetical protein